MNKYFIGIVTMLVIFIFSGCSLFYEYEETEFEATVLECEKGKHISNSYYDYNANNSLMNNDFSGYHSNKYLAEATGDYEYKITVCIDGENYTVTRYKPYEIGDTITITKVDTYLDQEFVTCEYK